MEVKEPIWLFDAVCILCSRSVQYTLAHEQKPEINFVAIQSTQGRELALKYNIDPDDPESFIFLSQGRPLVKLEGVIELARHLNGPARAIILFRFLPKPLRDWFYDRIAKNRYRWFGKSESCMMPQQEHKYRFVLPE